MKQKYNKYKNEKIIYKGIKFDSKKESRRYAELKLLERIGKIKDLELQKKFVLLPAFTAGKKKIREISYIADFVYKENETLVVEDVKGVKTDVYNIKKKIFFYKFREELDKGEIKFIEI